MARGASHQRNWGEERGQPTQGSAVSLPCLAQHVLARGAERKQEWKDASVTVERPGSSFVLKGPKEKGSKVT